MPGILRKVCGGVVVVVVKASFKVQLWWSWTIPKCHIHMEEFVDTLCNKSQKVGYEITWKDKLWKVSEGILLMNWSNSYRTLLFVYCESTDKSQWHNHRHCRQLPLRWLTGNERGGLLFSPLFSFLLNSNFDFCVKGIQSSRMDGSQPLIQASGWITGTNPLQWPC